jgi:GNAT superfamily N-acetyltransferase
MLWRCSRAEFEAGKGAGNRAAIKALVDAGSTPGILGYSDGRPIGWCAVAPRTCYPALARSRVLKAVDETPVWSVSCLFVLKSHRRRGVSVELLKGAGRFVAERGGSVVEGYPVEPRTPEMSAVFAWTGLPSAFLRAGFHEHRRGSATRPIMRLVVARASVVDNGSDA